MVEVPKKCPGCDYPIYELRATGGGRLICAVCGRTAQCDDFGNWSWDSPSPACLAAQVLTARTALDEALRDFEKAKAEIAVLKARAERAESDMASAKDVVNTWLRENGRDGAQVGSHGDIREAIDALVFAVQARNQRPV